MAYAGGKEIENSFNLQLQNVAPVETRVDLFQLGTTDITLNNNYSLMSSTYSQIYVGGDIGHIFSVNGAGGGAANPDNNEDIKIQTFGGGGGATFEFFNDDFVPLSAITPTLPIGATLTDVVEAINTALQTTTGFQGIYIGILFDFSTYTTTPTTSLPLSMYIVYSPTSTSKIATITVTNITGTLDPITITGLKLFPEIPCWANNYGIIVVPRNGIGYGEILESQNGQVLDIKSMSFIITTLSTAYSTNQQSQIYNCFSFQKIDINGNKIEYRKCPVVDVFSNPNINSIDDLQLERKADIYTLDGTTNLSYSLKSGIVVQIGSEFTRLTNLLQESKKGEKQIEIQKRSIQKNRLNTGYALDKVAVTKEDKKNQKGFNFSEDESKKKSPSTILRNSLLIFGGIATLLLVFNKK